MNANNALVLIFSRNAFYKRLHYLALAAFGLTLIAIAVLLALLVFLLRNPTHPLYFATDTVGRLIDIIPVDQPNMTTDEAMAWVVNAVEATYSYDYLHYRDQLQDAQKYYTNYGWSNYVRALTASNNLVALTERKMIVTAKVVEQPKVLAQGILAGAYAWRLQMPVLVSYSLPPYDEKSKFFNALDVVMIVQRQQALQGYKGLGIVQIVGTIAEGTSQPQEISGTSTGS